MSRNHRENPYSAEARAARKAAQDEADPGFAPPERAAPFPGPGTSVEYQPRVPDHCELPTPSIPTDFWGRLDLVAYREVLGQVTAVNDEIVKLNTSVAHVETARQHVERVYAHRQFLPQLIENDRLKLEQQRLAIGGQIAEAREDIQRRWKQGTRDAELDQLDYEIERERRRAELARTKADRELAEERAVKVQEGRARRRDARQGQSPGTREHCEEQDEEPAASTSTPSAGHKREAPEPMRRHLRAGKMKNDSRAWVREEIDRILGPVGGDRSKLSVEAVEELDTYEEALRRTEKDIDSGEAADFLGEDG